MFGGLAVCSLEAVVAKDGKEYIIEVSKNKNEYKSWTKIGQNC
jgi:hypothetical protein